MNFYWSGGIFCKKDLERQFGRKSKLHERITLALLRLSRDRYLSGEFVRRAAFKLACCRSGNPSATLRPIFNGEDMYRADHAGLLRGIVPFQDGGESFRNILETQNLNPKKKNMELYILNLIIKDMKNGN